MKRNKLKTAILSILILGIGVSELIAQVKFNVVPQVEGVFTIDRIFQFSLINLNIAKY
jgi:hypothetical protein